MENADNKMTDDVKDKIKTIVSDKLQWLESNSTASTEEFKDIKKEVEDVVNPLMQNTYNPDNTVPNTDEKNTPPSTNEPDIVEID